MSKIIEKAKTTTKKVDKYIPYKDSDFKKYLFDTSDEFHDVIEHTIESRMKKIPWLKKHIIKVRGINTSGDDISSSITYTLYDAYEISIENHAGAKLASFVIMQLPGCCGVALHTKTNFYDKEKYLEDISNIILDLKKAFCFYFNYTILFCTDVMGRLNKYFLKEFDSVFNFRNYNTGNDVDFFVMKIDLND